MKARTKFTKMMGRVLVLKAENQVEASLLKNWKDKHPVIVGYTQETRAGQRTWKDTLEIKFLMPPKFDKALELSVLEKVTA